MAVVLQCWRYLSDRVEGFYKSNPGLVSVLALIAAVVALIPRKAKQVVSEPSMRPISPATRRLLLDEVDQRAKVGHGLREAIRVDLNLTEMPSVVPVDLRLLENDGDVLSERSTREPIERIFADMAGGQLLILGEPGTGKTNLLLELARALVADAKTDADCPVPILFSLARWTIGERPRTLVDWMREDLRELYQLTRTDADTLIQADAIIPLFDGLDEVDEERRSACVNAINDYQGSRSLGRFAVCCRSDEYDYLLNERHSQSNLQVRAKLAIRVERLTQSDVEREVARPGFEHVQQLLNNDPELRRFVNTPLWLHVLYLGALAASSADADNPRDRLYDGYVTHVLKRIRTLGRPRRTEPSQLLWWLGWLAMEMQGRHQVQFTLEGLDFSWLSEKYNKRVRLVHRVSFGSAVGFAGGLVGGWIFGVLVGALAAIRLEGRVEAAERLRFDPRRAISRWRFSLGYGAIFGLGFACIHGPLAGLWMLLSSAVFEMLQGGFQPCSGGGGSTPNRATLRSLRYAVRVAAVGTAIAVSAIVIAQAAHSGHLVDTVTQRAVASAAAWVAFGGVILAGEKGGWFAMRHYAIRALLWRRGKAPADYVRFLNEAVERLFLVRRGGSYEFIHLTFLEYMATKYGTGRDAFQPPKTVTRDMLIKVRGSSVASLSRLPRFGTVRIAFVPPS